MQVTYLFVSILLKLKSEISIISWSSIALPNRHSNACRLTTTKKQKETQFYKYQQIDQSTNQVLNCHSNACKLMEMTVTHPKQKTHTYCSFHIRSFWMYNFLYTTSSPLFMHDTNSYSVRITNLSCLMKHFKCLKSIHWYCTCRVALPCVGLLCTQNWRIATDRNQNFAMTDDVNTTSIRTHCQRRITKSPYWPPFLIWSYFTLVSIFEPELPSSSPSPPPPKKKERKKTLFFRFYMWPNPTTSRKTCFWVNNHKRWLAQNYFQIFKFVFSCLLSEEQHILSNAWKNLFKWDFFSNNKWWIKSVNPYSLL